MKKGWICQSIGWSMVLLLGSACSTEVELCSGDHPHHTYVDIEFEWDKDYQGQYPDSMVVLAIRPVNYFETAFRTTSKASDNFGYVLYPESERHPLNDTEDSGNTGDTDNSDNTGGTEDTDHTGDAGNTEDTTPGTEGGATQVPLRTGEHISEGTTPAPSQDNSKIWLRGGEWRMMAYSGDAKSVGVLVPDDQQMGIEKFDSLRLAYRTYDKDAPEVKQYVEYWTDKNPYGKYVIGGVLPVYSCLIEAVNIEVDLHKERRTKVVFHPKKITQEITVNFELAKDSGIVVDSIVAELSGIPQSISLGNKKVDHLKTNKVFFKPVYDAAGKMTSADSAQTELLVCSGKVDVPGIVKAGSPDNTIGPGILQMVAFLHERRKSDNKVVNRAVRSIINLYEILTATPSLVWDLETKAYYIKSDKLNLNIGQAMKITAGSQNSGNNGTGVDDWEPDDDVHLDI